MAELLGVPQPDSDHGFERFNIAPTQEVLAAVDDEHGRRMEQLRWGLIPRWAQDAKPRFPDDQRARRDRARAPRLQGPRAAGRASLPGPGRRLVRVAAPEDPKQPRRPVHFSLPGGEPFCFAGPLDRAALASCTIVTCEANDLARPIHDRMPVVLAEPAGWEAWLDPALDGPAVSELLVPLPSDRLAVRPAQSARELRPERRARLPGAGAHPPVAGPVRIGAVTREDITFPSGGQTVPPGSTFRTAGTDPLPCVVMAHGFGGTRADAVPDFAERFVDAGLGGAGVRLPALRRQRGGAAPAARHRSPARGLDRGDRLRAHAPGDRRDTHRAVGIVVLGRSRRPDGRAGRPRAGRDLPGAVRRRVEADRLVPAFAERQDDLHGLRDQFRALLGRSPHYVPVVGPPGSDAVLQSPDCDAGYRAISVRIRAGETSARRA